MTAHGCTVVGIDASSEAIQAAAPFCTQTILADLDIEPLQNLLPTQEFDVAVFGDVLEHLREPWNVLDATRKLLSYRGYAVVSIPNIAHGAVRLGLLSGQFDYSEFGILDDTHLRFFTRRTLDQLFIRSGYRVERVERTILPLFEDSDLVPAIEEAQFDPATIAQVRSDPEAETLQFVVLAQALTDDEHMAQLGRHYAFATARSQALDGTRRMLESTDTELKRTQVAYSELEARATELAEEPDRLIKPRLEALDHDLRAARKAEAAGILERENLRRELRELTERFAIVNEVAATAERWKLDAQSREVGLDILAARLSSLQLALEAANTELAAMKRSRSWRVTSLLRAVTGALRRGN
jgi:hypothetical protein